MFKKFKNTIYQLLRKSEKWAQTDMVYLAKGGFWISLGQFFSMIMFFALSIIFANWLTPEIYGRYKFILAIFNLLTITSLGGISTAITQSVARGYEGSIIPAIKKKIKWGSLGTITALLLAIYYYQKDETLFKAMLLISIFVPFFNTFKIYTSFLRGRKLFKINTNFEVISKLINIGTLAIAIILSNNLYIILLAYFIPKLSTQIFFFLKTKCQFKFNNKTDPQTIPYGIYLSLLGIITKIANELDKILLWHFLGPVEVAIYSFAVSPIQQITGFLKSNVSVLSAPKLSQNSWNIIKKTLPKKVLKMFFVVAPIIVLYYFIAPYLFRFFYPNYLNAIPYSRFFALSILILPTSLFGGALINQIKKREVAIIRFVSPSIRIILLLFLVPFYGIIGVISARLLSNLFHIILVSILFFKSK